jgi:hypothetical protein
MYDLYFFLYDLYFFLYDLYFFLYFIFFLVFYIFSCIFSCILYFFLYFFLYFIFFLVFYIFSCILYNNMLPSPIFSTALDPTGHQDAATKNYVDTKTQHMITTDTTINLFGPDRLELGSSDYVHISSDDKLMVEINGDIEMITPSMSIVADDLYIASDMAVVGTLIVNDIDILNEIENLKAGDGVVIVYSKNPVMTSNNQEGFITTASSFYNPSFQAYQIYNNLPEEGVFGSTPSEFSYYWGWASGIGTFENNLATNPRTKFGITANQEWHQLEMPQSRTFSSFKIKGRGDFSPTSSIRDYKVLISEDGITWTTVLTVTDYIQTIQLEEAEYSITGTGKYLGISITKNNGSDSSLIGEVFLTFSDDIKHFWKEGYFEELFVGPLAINVLATINSQQTAINSQQTAINSQQTAINSQQTEIDALKAAILILQPPVVKDLYIFAGQSNMDGRAAVVPDSVDRTDTLFYKESATSTSSVIDSSFIGLVNGNTSNQQSGVLCPVISFHDRVKELNTTNTIAVMKFARGGTDLHTHWNTTASGNFMFTKFLESLDDAQSKLTNANVSYVIKGMVWLQGESDTNNTTDAGAYQQNLNDFIASVRTHLSLPALPVVIVGIKNAGQLTNAQTVRNAQESVANADGNIRYVYDSTWGQQDSLHYNTAGQTAIGRAVADEMLNAIAGVYFTPTDLSTDLLGWYDMDTISTSNGKVDSWYDKTSNNRNLTQPGALRPTYQDSNSILTDAGTYLQNNNPYMYAQGGIDVFMICSQNASGPAFMFCEGGSTNTQYSFCSSGVLGMRIVSDSNNIKLTQNTSTGSSVAVDTGNYMIYNWTDTGSNITGRVNAETGGVGVGYIRDTSTMDNITLGGVFRTSLAGQSVIQVKEIIVIQKDLSIANRQKIEGYLAHKHALTYSIPDDHPYKLSPPL